ncbi:MAG: xanthine dehydrogenase family protein subunit M [Chloroflexi bacterium]|nr:xanthine dehydrogenase family protein subunit M [Chloroflexota bacterium]
MENFQYVEPATIPELLALLAKHGEEAKVMAGGQSLIVMMREELVNPKVVIGLRGLPELTGINDRAGEGLILGAMATHRAVEKSGIVQERCRVLSQMETMVASVQVRNKGTIGGAVCHAAPDGDPSPCLLALGASAIVAGSKGQREVPLDGFFVDTFQTALRADEVLTALCVPALSPRTGASYVKFSARKALDPSIVSVAVAITLGSDGVCQEARIALSGAGPVPARAKRAEGMLKGEKPQGSLIKQVAAAVAEETKPISDFRASSEYRRVLARVLSTRAIDEALAQV